MVTTLPIDGHAIVRAADAMIEDYGLQALSTATEREQKLREEGFESVANAWELICHAIEEREGYRNLKRLA